MFITGNRIAFSMNSRPASVLEEKEQRKSNDSSSLGKSEDRSGLIFSLCRAVMLMCLIFSSEVIVHNKSAISIN